MQGACEMGWAEDACHAYSAGRWPLALKVKAGARSLRWFRTFPPGFSTLWLLVLPALP